MKSFTDTKKMKSKKKRIREHAVDGKLYFIVSPQQRKQLDALAEQENVSLQGLGRGMVAGFIAQYLQTGKLPFDTTPYRKKQGRKRVYEELLREIESGK